MADPVGSQGPEWDDGAATAPTEPELPRTLESPPTTDGSPPMFYDLNAPPLRPDQPAYPPGSGYPGYGAPGAAHPPAPYPVAQDAGGGYPPPYGYGATPYGPYAYGAYAPPKNNGLAVASMVLGICGFVLCQIFAIPGLFLGLRARRQIRESNGTETGDAFALAGIILSGIGVALLVLIVIVYGLFFGLAFTSGI